MHSERTSQDQAEARDRTLARVSLTCFVLGLLSVLGALGLIYLPVEVTGIAGLYRVLDVLGRGAVVAGALGLVSLVTGLLCVGRHRYVLIWVIPLGIMLVGVVGFFLLG